MDARYNTQNPAVKRLMREALEMQQNPNELFSAAPLEENLFEWHFTIRGPSDSDFDGGVFHGRILMPADYPMKPPSIILLTPNGRFETNKKICLSISGHHPESWQPCWSIRTALLAIIGFMPSPGAGAVGSLDMSTHDRRQMARKSLEWYCPTCNLHMKNALPPLTKASNAMRDEAQRLGRQLTSGGNVTVEKKTNLNSNAIDEEEAGGDSSPSDEGDAPLTISRQAMQHELRRRLIQQTSPNPSNYASDSSLGVERFAMDTLLVFICVLLIALVARRLYMQNEWRFHR